MDWSGFAGSAGKTIGGFLSARAETKAKNAVIKRQNENRAVMAAHNAGVISQDRAAIISEEVTSQVKIQRARAKAVASARVAAAAAGVAGGSVRAAEHDIDRSAAERSFEISTLAVGQLRKAEDALWKNKVNLAMQKKTMLAAPSAMGLMLGLAGDFATSMADDQGSDGTDEPF